MADVLHVFLGDLHSIRIVLLLQPDLQLQISLLRTHAFPLHPKAKILLAFLHQLKGLLFSSKCLHFLAAIWADVQLVLLLFEESQHELSAVGCLMLDDLSLEVEQAKPIICTVAFAANADVVVAFGLED